MIESALVHTYRAGPVQEDQDLQNTTVMNKEKLSLITVFDIILNHIVQIWVFTCIFISSNNQLVLGSFLLLLLFQSAEVQLISRKY